MSADFIDSNVFLYLFDETDPDKRQTAEALVQGALETGTASISFQVIQEVLNILTRKLGAAPEDARRFMEHMLVPLWRIMPSQALYSRALELQARYGFSFYDSLIIAAALEGGCTRLYSEDLQHGQRIERLVIENPFLEG
ncbi:PIN domain-containing protein [soil metagenome]|jgi:predicted nucleic acid-binding protein|nr:PIN domain-containing protein [Deinococcota bacterium]